MQIGRAFLSQGSIKNFFSSTHQKCYPLDQSPNLPLVAFTHLLLGFSPYSTLQERSKVDIENLNEGNPSHLTTLLCSEYGVKFV